MKKLFSFWLLAVVFVCGSTFTAAAQIESVALQASGLTCSMCSKAIYKALEKIPSISKIDVDIAQSTYHIRFKQGQPIQLDAIKEAVKSAGFSVSSLTIQAKFNQAAVYDDAHVQLDNHRFHFVHVPKQTLNGETTLVLLDKDFMPEKTRKKYAGYTQMNCYHTGTMKGKAGEERIYHVTVQPS